MSSMDEGMLDGSCLCRAIMRGTVADVQAILDVDTAALNQQDSAGWYPLHWAARNGDTEKIALLLQRGALVGALTKNTELTPLHVAVKERQTEAVGALLAVGAALNSVDADGATALFTAAMMGHEELVAVLLDHGADPNFISDDPNLTWTLLYGLCTPLHAAVFQGHVTIVRSLLAAGADTQRTDKDGRRPVDLARTDEMRQVFQEHALACQTSELAVSPEGVVAAALGIMAASNGGGH